MLRISTKLRQWFFGLHEDEGAESEPADTQARSRGPSAILWSRPASADPHMPRHPQHHRTGHARSRTCSSWGCPQSLCRSCPEVPLLYRWVPAGPQSAPSENGRMGNSNHSKNTVSPLLIARFCSLPLECSDFAQPFTCFWLNLFRLVCGWRFQALSEGEERIPASFVCGLCFKGKFRSVLPTECAQLPCSCPHDSFANVRSQFIHIYIYISCLLQLLLLWFCMSGN